MRRIDRRPLSPAVVRFLKTDRADKIAAIPDHAAKVREVKRLWKLQKNKSFKEIRATLAAMATGRARCMYCEDSAGTDIEHFRPKATFPDRAFDWSNYLWACSYCNSNLKRDQFPCDAHGDPLLIDPTVDDPQHHLALTPTTGAFSERTPKGKESITVFGLNDERSPRALPRGREFAWDKLQEFIIIFGRYQAAGRLDRAEKIRRVMCEEPFSGVFVWLLAYSADPSRRLLLDPECHATIEQWPEIATWI